METIFKVAKFNCVSHCDVYALYTNSMEQADSLEKIFSVDDDQWENTYVERRVMLSASDKVYLLFKIMFNDEGVIDSIEPMFESVVVGSDELLRDKESVKIFHSDNWAEIIVKASSVEEATGKARAKYAEAKGE